MTTTNEMDVSMALVPTDVTTDETDGGSMVIGTPAEAPAPVEGPAQENIYVYANSVTGGSDVPGSNITTFDVTFTVSCTCPESGKYTTYQMIKRIGVDKVKMAAEAASTVPVSIVEGTRTAAQVKAEIKDVSSKIDKIVQDGGKVTLTDPLTVKMNKLRAELKKLDKPVKEEYSYSASDLKRLAGLN